MLLLSEGSTWTQKLSERVIAISVSILAMTKSPNKKHQENSR